MASVLGSYPKGLSIETTLRYVPAAALAMMMVFIVDHAATVATGQTLSARGSTASLQLTWSQYVCGWSNVSPDAQQCAAERVGLAAENPWIQATRPAGPGAALTLMACVMWAAQGKWCRIREVIGCRTCSP